MPLETSLKKNIEVDIEKNLRALLDDEDTDHDQKITVEDFLITNTDKGDKRFSLEAIDGKTYEIYGTYYLANLLQELARQRDADKATATITAAHIFENPVNRVARLIKETYWDGLTRRIDANNLAKILTDEKMGANASHYLYVPHKDDFAFDYFSNAAKNFKEMNLKVVKLPEEITPAFVKNLQGKHGLLTLKLAKSPSGEIAGAPFVVPGGRFNEMYGWDSYFESLGLLQDGRLDLAKAMVENFVYEIENYGKILNANRSYYLTRSQPPFLTSMALAVYKNMPQNEDSKQWLKKALQAAIKEYHTVWMNKDRLTATGLSRYYGSGIGVPPEVEPGHFDAIFKEFAEKHHLPLEEFNKQYKAKKIDEPALDEFFRHDRAVRESGHDTTYRWRRNGEDRCANFVTVDLNALLYRYEIDIAYMVKEIFAENMNGEKSQAWLQRAQKRKSLIMQYLWNEDKQMFFDYDFVHKQQSDYISATTFYPLWAWRTERPETKILDDPSAQKCIDQALSYLESNGGVSSTAQESRERYGIEGVERQWDYPFGWAPHQILIWKALENYGDSEIADRLIYKWLYTIVKNAQNYNGTIPEKYNVITRSHKVFAEYGNVGTHFSYMTKEGFGWMNASYQIGLGNLSDKWRPSLEKLIPPEWLDF